MSRDIFDMALYMRSLTSFDYSDVDGDYDGECDNDFDGEYAN